MFGLIISDPGQNETMRKRLTAMLASYDLPVTAYTEDPASFFADAPIDMALIRRCCTALLRPGEPIPAELLMAMLCGGNVRYLNALRKYLNLQMSLVPTLRTHTAITDLPGGHLLGLRLLVVHVDENDHAECLLPAGKWTDINNGASYEKKLNGLFGLNEMPVLARENALLAIGVNDRTATADDADRVTLHWYQPQGEAACTLADGTTFHVSEEDDGYRLISNTMKPWHLIVHQGNDELLIR